MKKADRRDYISRRADELARTGQYRNWLLIEAVISREGFPEARQVLDDSFKRESLKRLCASHYKDVPHA
jgi:hypothetical protein